MATGGGDDSKNRGTGVQASCVYCRMYECQLGSCRRNEEVARNVFRVNTGLAIAPAGCMNKLYRREHLAKGTD